MSVLVLGKQTWEPMELGGQASICVDQRLKVQCTPLRNGQPGVLGRCSGKPVQGQALQKLRAVGEAPAGGQSHRSSCPRCRESLRTRSLVAVSLQSSPQNVLAEPMGGGLSHWGGDRLLPGLGHVLLGVAGFWNVPLGGSGASTARGRCSARLLRIDWPGWKVCIWKPLVFEPRQDCVLTSAHRQGLQ